METLSVAEARLAFLAAQGVPRRRRTRRPSAASVLEIVRRQEVVQIDSVNVLARAHYLPVFSRAGPYDVNDLDRLAYRDRALYEAWSHAASLVPIELWPHHEWRRQAARKEWARYMSPAATEYAGRVLDDVRGRGPLAAGELADIGVKRAGSWWNRSAGKQALEYLFAIGEVAVADRRHFERVYDLTANVIPSEILEAPVVGEDEARRELVLRSVRALGVGTLDDIADYFRQKLTPTKRVLADLVASGDVIRLTVAGWDQAAYALPDVNIPRRVSGGSLLNPFDPIVWHRPRTERLFGFHYRIEIYVPAPKRIHGYYVLPFLLDDRFVARVDLKADRPARTLRVFASWIEPPADAGAVAAALAGELALLRDWLGLDDIDVQDRGDLAAPLSAAAKSL